MRFSMLSLTFCSWPDRVCMTNHWLRMISELKQDEQLHENRVHHHSEPTQNNNRYSHHDRRSLQFLPRRPGAFAQLFSRLLHISRKTRQMARPPQPGEERANDDDPNDNPSCVCHI